MNVPAEQDIIENAHPIEEREVLKRPGHTELCNLVGCRAGNVLSGQPDSPLVWRVEPGDCIGKRRLATAIRPNKAEDFPSLDDKIDTGDSNDTAKTAFAPCAFQYRLIT